MSPATRSRLLLAVGIALVTLPLRAPPLDVTGSYVYQTRRRQFLSGKPFTERVLEGAAVLTGLLARRRAWQNTVRVTE